MNGRSFISRQETVPLAVAGERGGGLQGGGRGRHHLHAQDRGRLPVRQLPPACGGHGHGHGRRQVRQIVVASTFSYPTQIYHGIETGDAHGTDFFCGNAIVIVTHDVRKYFYKVAQCTLWASGACILS